MKFLKPGAHYFIFHESEEVVETGAPLPLPAGSAPPWLAWHPGPVAVCRTYSVGEDAAVEVPQVQIVDSLGGIPEIGMSRGTQASETSEGVDIGAPLRADKTPHHPGEDGPSPSVAEGGPNGSWYTDLCEERVGGDRSASPKPTAFVTAPVLEAVLEVVKHVQPALVVQVLCFFVCLSSLDAPNRNVRTI